MRLPVRLATAGCACLLLLGCGDLNMSSRQTPRDPTASAFRVLRTDPEHLPSSLADHIARLLHLPTHAALDNTQLTQTQEGSVWVFLSGEKMCLVQANLGSVSCSTKRRARRQGVTLGTFEPPSEAIPRLHRFLVLGVQPDDVRYISATVGRQPHERRVRVPVRHNIFAIAAERPVLIRGFGRR